MTTTPAQIERPAESPVVQWHPWQRRLFDDPARVIAVNWHRQAGKDFCAAGKAVDHAMRTGQPWYVVSLTQRQSDATASKARMFADAMARVARRRAQISLEDAEFAAYDKWIGQTFRFTSRSLRLPGGGSVTALPGRDPDTLAGLTGNVIFTEFGLFPGGGYDHWRVVFPLATRGFSIIAISTPRGQNTRFYELCSDPQTYSVHTQTILDSVSEGFVLCDNRGNPTTVDEFKRLYHDDAGWVREYLCEFSGDAEALISWAKLLAAGERGADLPFYLIRIGGGFLHKAEDVSKALAGVVGRVEIGWDVARHGDLSSIWIQVPSPNVGRSLRALVLMKNVEFSVQRDAVRAAMRSSPSAVGAGDATGLGMDSNETLAAEFPGRWQGVTFTPTTKREMASRLAALFDDGQIALPATTGPHRMIAADLYALQRIGDAENLAVAESDNPLLEDSHCDVAWSAALAQLAARAQGPSAYVTVGGQD